MTKHVTTLLLRGRVKTGNDCLPNGGNSGTDLCDYMFKKEAVQMKDYHLLR